MNRLLCTVALVGACVIGLGFYMGWFHLGSESAEGKSNVTLTVDKDKIQKDSKTAVAKVEDIGLEMKDKVAGSNQQTTDGKTVSVTADKLVMTSAEGVAEHTYTLAADIKVTCDGKTCKAADLKSGMKVRVTTENAKSQIATRIEALDSNLQFSKGV